MDPKIPSPLSNLSILLTNLIFSASSKLTLNAVYFRSDPINNPIIPFVRYRQSNKKTEDLHKTLNPFNFNSSDQSEEN